MVFGFCCCYCYCCCDGFVAVVTVVVAMVGVGVMNLRKACKHSLRVNCSDSLESEKVQMWMCGENQHHGNPKVLRCKELWRAS